MKRAVLDRAVLTLAVALAFLWPQDAQATVNRDVSFKAGPLALAKALPQLRTPAEDALAKAARADECEALCELAASVEEAPFGYVLGRRPPLGRIFLYDDTSLLAEYDTNGNEVAKYDYGGDRLIRLTRSDEGTRYFSFDGLGSVTGLTDATGAVTAAYHLDAWGNYRFTSELAPSKNRFGFTGHYWDNEAGLYYAKARFYDPVTARFTQADSFLGNIDDPPSLHRYFYANANPTFYVDGDGHSATAVVAAAGFAWGVGQAIGGFIDDHRQGKYRSVGDYLGTVASNTAGGALIGASVDATILTGGLGAATVGALGGAGAALITTGGESRGLGESLERGGYGAAGGAIGGAVLSKAAPLLGRVAGRVATWAGEHVPFASEGGQALSAMGRRAAGAAGDAAEWVASKYKPGALGDRLSSIPNPFQRFTSSSTSTTRVTIEESVSPNGPVPSSAARVRGHANPIGEQGPFFVNESGVAQTGRGIVRLERRGFLKFEGLEVRGARDLSHAPEGTLRVMRERGFAGTDPVTRDPLIMHHMDQNPAGPLVEVPGPRHSVWNTRQHPLGNVPGVGLSAELRAAFNQWRAEYWKARATEELAKRGVQ